MVESVFALQKFLSTRERGGLQRNRNGWVMFKKNGTARWAQQLPDGRLKLYTDVARASAAKLAKAEGGRRQQLARVHAHTADERRAKLLAKRAARAKKVQVRC